MLPIVRMRWREDWASYRFSFHCQEHLPTTHTYTHYKYAHTFTRHMSMNICTPHTYACAHCRTLLYIHLTPAYILPLSSNFIPSFCTNGSRSLLTYFLFTKLIQSLINASLLISSNVSSSYSQNWRQTPLACVPLHSLCLGVRRPSSTLVLSWIFCATLNSPCYPSCLIQAWLGLLPILGHRAKVTSWLSEHCSWDSSVDSLSS